MVIASYLSHPGTSDVSAPRRSGVMPVQRWEAWCDLEHAAHCPPSALAPVLSYRCPPV